MRLRKGRARQTVDLFLIAGQSNAEGMGDKTLSPSVTSGRGFYINARGVSDLKDPVGGAQSGSAWPAFANQWYALTGRNAAFTEAAVGGTSLLAAVGDPNWSTTGTLYGLAVTALETAIAVVEAQSWITLNSVNVLWCQGETDANSVNGTTVTGALYEAELTTLCNNFAEDIPELNRVFMFRTGTRNDGVAAAGYTAIRAAQDNVAAALSHVEMVFTNAVNFLAEGKMADTYHYTQPGYDEMGETGATNAAPFV